MKNLTETFLKKIDVVKNAGKKIFDKGMRGQRGLYLYITPNGVMSWRFNYKFNRKNKTLYMGQYPVLTLEDARNEVLEAKRNLIRGIDPCERKRAKNRHKNEKLDPFGEVAEAWYQNNRSNWKNEKHAWQVKNTLSRLKKLAEEPIQGITTPMIVEALETFEHIPETYKRTKQRVKMVFDYAILKGKFKGVNPALTIPNLKQKVKPQPALPKELIPQFFNDLATYGNRKTQLAMEFLILSFVRVGELRLMEWAEIDFKNKQWLIPAHKMKMNREHIVPLSDRALEILEEMKNLNKYANPCVFVGNHHKPISNVLLSQTMKKLGYQGIATPHGFRAMASTILNESGLFNPDAIERQLSHCEENKVRGAYNRAEYLEERQKMMQWYANYIKSLCNN